MHQNLAIILRQFNYSKNSLIVLVPGGMDVNEKVTKFVYTYIGLILGIRREPGNGILPNYTLTFKESLIQFSKEVAFRRPNLQLQVQ